MISDHQWLQVFAELKLLHARRSIEVETFGIRHTPDGVHREN